MRIATLSHSNTDLVLAIHTTDPNLDLGEAVCLMYQKHHAPEATLDEIWADIDEGNLAYEETDSTYGVTLIDGVIAELSAPC